MKRMLVVCIFIALCAPAFAQEKKDGAKVPADAPSADVLTAIFGDQKPGKWANIFGFGVGYSNGALNLPPDTNYSDDSKGVVIKMEYFHSFSGFFKLGVGLDLSTVTSDKALNYITDRTMIAPYGTFELWFKLRDDFSGENPIATAIQEIYKDHVNIHVVKYQPTRIFLYLKAFAGYAFQGIEFESGYYSSDILSTGGGYFGGGIGYMYTEGALKGFFVQVLTRVYTGNIRGTFASGPKDDRFSAFDVTVEFGWRFSLD